MAQSNDLLMYDDCRQAMESALEQTIGVKVECASSGMAVNFRQRCYKYRRLCKILAMQKSNEDDPDFGFSAYDALAMACEGPFVVIRRREYIQPKITIISENEVDIE